MAIKNEYEIMGDEVHLKLYHKNGESRICVIDKDKLEKIDKANMKWHLFWSRGVKTYYAKATKYLGMDEQGRSIGKTVYLHRFVTDCPKDMTVDHLNHDTLNNKLSNLKVVTVKENVDNRENRANRNSKTGVRNVTYTGGKYIVQFQISRKNKIMGRFNTLDEAKEFTDNNRYKYYKNA